MDIDKATRAVTHWSGKEYDWSSIDAAPQPVLMAYESAQLNRQGAVRLYLVTTYGDGTQYHRTGLVGITTGSRPCFLLMGRASDTGSGDLLTQREWEEGATVVAGIQHDGRGYYTPGNVRQNIPGVEYRTEPGAHRVMPGRRRFTHPAK